MMLYMMPAIFTIMMFFLPAGLGVYMLTNTWLGIGQQLLVERYIGSKVGAARGHRGAKSRKDSRRRREAAAFGKGKARARGMSPPQKTTLDGRRGCEPPPRRRSRSSRTAAPTWRSTS
jgi:hypothetical protein